MHLKLKYDNIFTSSVSDNKIEKKNVEYFAHNK